MKSVAGTNPDINFLCIKFNFSFLLIKMYYKNEAEVANICNVFFHVFSKIYVALYF